MEGRKEEEAAARNEGGKEGRKVGPALRQLMNHLGTDPRSPVRRDGAMQ